MPGESVDELLRRHGEKKKVDLDVRTQVERLVNRLLKKHPGHRDVIMRHLEGQWQRLLKEREKERQDARKRNGSI